MVVGQEASGQRGVTVGKLGIMESVQSKISTKSIVFVIVAMASIQLGASFAKNLFPLTGAAGASLLRLFFATLILWALWRPWQTRIHRSQFKHLLIYGGSLGLMNLLFYFALDRIPLGIAVALEFTGPLGVALYNSKQRLDYLWVALAGLGIYLLLPLVGGTLDPIGICLALGAGLFWALYILYGQKAGLSLHGGLAATWGMTFAFLVVLPVGVWSAGTRLLDLSLLPLGLSVAILSSALPYSLEMVALKQMPARTFGIFMSLEPALGAGVGLILLGELLTALQWLAIACVIVASLGSTLTTRKA
jgi:inner membrane transporter RhtA